MIIYADLTFINNFFMTLAILWALGQVLEKEISWYRLVLAAGIGSIYTFLVLLIQYQMPLSVIKYLVQLLLNIIVALVIIRLSFPELRGKKFFRAIAYLYLLSFITIGTTLSIFYINGGSPPLGKGTVLILTALIVIYLLGKNAWRLFQNYFLPPQLLLPVVIIFNKQEVHLTGLVDTGNKLTDPLTQVPVMVVSLPDILTLFPVEIQAKLSAGAEMDILNTFLESGLGKRVRVLPFSAIAQENGLLVGFRPDLLKIKNQEEWIVSRKVILGINRYRLSEEDEYQALIHPQLLKLEA